MTCRHQSGDPDCSSHPDNIARRASEAREYEQAQKYAMTPDAEKFEILDMTRVGTYVVLKVKYPNCTKCAFEGTKVMVFPHVSELDILKWRRIDPHFRDPQARVPANSAPCPLARFPATTLGWADALAYATSKAGR